MPRPLSALLTRCLERANPAVREVVEFAVPDQAAVLHRAEDQLLGAPDPLLSLDPVGSLVPTASGGVTLNSTDDLIIDQFHEDSEFGIPQENGGPTFLHTAAWTIDPGFQGAVLRSVSVRLRWSGLLWQVRGPDISLRILRAHRQAGVLQRIDGSSVVESEAVEITFTDLLPEPIVAREAALYAAGAFDGSGYVTVTFDLTPYHLLLEPIAPTPAGPAYSGDLPELYFTLQTNQQRAGDFVHWQRDETSALDIAGVGRVRELHWGRADDQPGTTWEATETGHALCLRVGVDAYVPASEAVYVLALPALPDDASEGRVVFDVGIPRGATAALELSTDGDAGPFVEVADGDAVTVYQTLYHARLSLGASADTRRAPVVSRLGVEFRRVVDLTPESTVDHVTQDVSVPYLVGSVGEGSVRAIRAGRRDYRDLASDLATAGPDTQLECDVYLAPRHPRATRADWLRLSRATVSGRDPSGTSERLTLLAATNAIAGKIPARVESITRRHAVLAATATQVQVAPDLQGVSPTGNEYDARGYYVRVARSAVSDLPAGSLYTITGNTGVDRLDFTGSDELPAAFAVGDELEVHSAQYLQPALAWANADPADVWEEILITHRNIPSSRIGRADVGASGRGGRPPRVTDRAPGDTATQAKLRVSTRITAAEDAAALIDQLSFIMGGTTVEIGGQIVFRQIYPLFDAAGAMTVAPDAPVAVFDPRDFAGLQTPTGREGRVSVLACDYGVNPAGTGDESPLTVVLADVDAVNAYGSPEGDAPTIPSEIARWCYNSTDQGRFLATQLIQQVTSAASTGLRLWPWTSVEARPGLTVGDAVVLVTDQYTDFDPAAGRAIRGWNAYTLVLTGTGGGGRQFTGFLRGLRDVAALRVRGGLGTLQDIGAPSVTVDVTPDTDAWTLAWSGRPLVELSIDGGVFSPPGASPIVVPLDEYAHVYRFRASGVGAPAEKLISIPAFASAGASFSAMAIGVPNYTSHVVPITWSAIGAPVGATYTVTVEEQVGGNVYNRYVYPGVTSPYSYAPNDNAMIAGGAHTANLRASVQMLSASGATVLATSATDERTFDIF